MNIILLAPPAAGKGTQAKKIISKYNLKHISTGDLLRNALKKNDEMAMKIESIMNSGKLVNDDIILKLIENELENSENGVVLDGFPRNLNQALECEQLFKKLNQKIDYVLYFEIDKEIAKKRVVGRRTCSNCGRIYNTLIESEMPKIKEICNDCNILLIHRSDDNEETFDLRYETYMKETNPLIAFYEDKGILKRIDSSLNTEEVFKTIEKVLDGDL